MAACLYRMVLYLPIHQRTPFCECVCVCLSLGIAYGMMDAKLFLSNVCTLWIVWNGMVFPYPTWYFEWDPLHIDGSIFLEVDLDEGMSCLSRIVCICTYMMMDTICIYLYIHIYGILYLVTLNVIHDRYEISWMRFFPFYSLVGPYRYFLLDYRMRCGEYFLKYCSHVCEFGPSKEYIPLASVGWEWGIGSTSIPYIYTYMLYTCNSFLGACGDMFRV